MKTTITSILILSGCVSSYSGEKSLEFAAVPYESVDGKAWTEDQVPLPGIAEKYGLPEPPKVTTVELNPNGRTTLLFIHGLGSNLKFWRYQLDAFAAEKYRVVAFDMLGYGKSDKPATFPYTMDAMADVVRELAEAIDADRPILIGHSMGGHVAMTFAIRFPVRLSALVLASPAGFEAFSRREKAWFRKGYSTALIKGAGEDAIWKNIRQNNFNRWRSEYEWLVEERVRVARGPEFDQYAYANVKSVQGLTETDFVRENLGAIKAPTLIVYGDRDRLIPNPFMHGGSTRQVMELGRDGIAGSELVALDGCGHMIQMDCAERYNQGVRDFLARVASGALPIARD
jgi:pimeloyl-ACP methyl ester carboxylesterase